MNARQKAKHFKRLYETKLIRPKIIQFPESGKLQHYTTKKMVLSHDDEDFPEEMMHTIICRELIRNFEETMINNVEVEEDDGRRKIYRLDIWLGK